MQASVGRISGSSGRHGSAPTPSEVAHHARAPARGRRSVDGEYARYLRRMSGVTADPDLTLTDMSCPPEAARRQDTGLRPDRGRFAHRRWVYAQSRDRCAARPRGMLDLRWPVPGAQPFHVHEGTPRSASPAPGVAGGGHVVVVGCRPRSPALGNPGLTALPGLERTMVVLPGTPPPGWNGAAVRGADVAGKFQVPEELVIGRAHDTGRCEVVQR